MARSLQQPDSEVDWNFSEQCMKVVKSVAREAEFKNDAGLLDAQDVEQELLLWLALRKEARDKWEAGHSATLWRNVSRAAQDIANRAQLQGSREVLVNDEEWEVLENNSRDFWPDPVRDDRPFGTWDHFTMDEEEEG